MDPQNFQVYARMSLSECPEGARGAVLIQTNPLQRLVCIFQLRISIYIYTSNVRRLANYHTPRFWYDADGKPLILCVTWPTYFFGGF